MNNYPIDEFISGGYFLTKYTDRSEYMSSDLIPTRLVSASHCIVDIVPDAWAVEWGAYNERARQREASKFGITPDTLPQVIRWVTDRIDSHDIGWPAVFNSTDVARQFADQFLSNNHDIVLIGIGLSRTLVNTFLEEEKPPVEYGTPGVYEALTQYNSLESGAEVLGFEVLGFDTSHFHSWLCNGLEVDCNRELEIRPNSYGFIDTFEEASACAEYASRDDVGAEPAFWQPWLIVQYPVYT